MNNTIIDCFEKLIVKAQAEKANNFKIISYRKLINIIKKLDFTITNTDQIKSIKGIGKSSINRIEEILNTGKLSELDTLSNTLITENDKQSDLIRITGIGPVKAKKLLEKDITLEVLLDAYKNNNSLIEDNLTHHQIIGVKYFHDLEKKIPQKEIKNIEKYINKIIKKIDNSLNITICGSYRRQKPESGDIDILITHDSIITEKQLTSITYLKDLIDILTKNKFIVDNLTYNGNTNYMGLCKYKSNPVRRIDIRFIPLDCYASSLLYFTGSGEFNKNMRTYAIKNGYTLNEYGLYKQIKINNKKVKIKTNSEEDIFKSLNLNYVEPQFRFPNHIFK